jgi:hypothetical protein
MRGQREKTMDDGKLRNRPLRIGLRTTVWNFVLLCLAFCAASTHAQIDPEKRRLFQLGYNEPIQGSGPLAAYGFYYYNQPGFLDHTNITARMALAPVYVDSELGFSGLLGPNTDLAFGLAGGGWADSYFEVRHGKYLRGESFDGHGAELNSSIYHRFNPDAEIPLNGVLRLATRAHFFDETDHTDPAFRIPDNFESLYLRTGLRFGGREPSNTSPLAMELSIWYEGHFRTDGGSYGYGGDRRIESHTHLIWTRALLKYTFPESKQYFDATLTLGDAANPDRLSAFRLGGYLPFISEFPLNIPGYYYQELSATRFALLNGLYFIPLDAKKQWNVTFFGAVGAVDYLTALQQPGHIHEGVGGGVGYTSTSGTWFIQLIYGHAFSAIRNGGRGADQVGLVVQYDLEAKAGQHFRPNVNPYGSQGTERIFR